MTRTLTRLAAWLGITREPIEHTLTADGFDVCPACIANAQREARR